MMRRPTRSVLFQGVFVSLEGIKDPLFEWRSDCGRNVENVSLRLHI